MVFFNFNKTLFSKNLFDILNFLNRIVMSMEHKETGYNLVVVSQIWFAKLMDAVLKFRVISFYVIYEYFNNLKCVP